MPTRPLRTAAAGLAVLLMIPAAGAAEPLTPARMFANASPLPKLILVGLALSVAAAVVVCAMKLLSGRRRPAGSAFLSSLRLGGPLAGLLGSATGLLNMTVGISNARTPPSLTVLAPGFAEAVLLFGMGLLAGSVAVIAHWAVDARVGRTAAEA